MTRGRRALVRRRNPERSWLSVISWKITHRHETHSMAKGVPSDCALHQPEHLHASPGHPGLPPRSARSDRSRPAANRSGSLTARARQAELGTEAALQRALRLTQFRPPPTPGKHFTRSPESRPAFRTRCARPSYSSGASAQTPASIRCPPPSSAASGCGAE